jgi:hypothetical protein
VLLGRLLASISPLDPRQIAQQFARIKVQNPGEFEQLDNVHRPPARFDAGDVGRGSAELVCHLVLREAGSLALGDNEVPHSEISRRTKGT